MTVRPSKRAERPDSGGEPPLMSTRALLVVSIAVVAALVSVIHPVWGASILVGTAVLTLLNKIVGG